MDEIIAGPDKERAIFLEEMAGKILKELGIPFTRNFLREAIGSAYYKNILYNQQASLDPDAESVVNKNDPINLAIVLMDALRKFHIKNAVVNEPVVVEDKCMLITLVSGEQENFYGDLIGFVKPSTGLVTFGNAEHKLNDIKSRIEFYIALTPTQLSGEPDRQLHRKKDILKKSLFSAAFSVFSITIIAALYFGITKLSSLQWLPGLVAAILGVILSFNLLSLEKSKSKPGYLAKKFCGTEGNGSSCRDILSSSASKLFGLVSMASIGMVYFTSLSCYTIVSLLSNNYSGYAAVLFWASAIALPYTFFSVYYQLMVLRKTCALCMSVVVLLWLQFAWFLFISKYIDLFHIEIIPALSFLVTAIMVTYSFYLLENFNHFKNDATRQLWEITNLRDDPEVFNAVMNQQPPGINGPGIPGSIVLGTYEAPVKLMAFISLLCPHCIEMFHRLRKLNDWFGEDLCIEIFVIADPRSVALQKEILHRTIVGNQPEAIDLLMSWYNFFSKNKGIKNSSANEIVDRWLEDHKIHNNDLEPGNRITQAAGRFEKWLRTTFIPHAPFLILDGKILPGSYYDGDLLNKIVERKVEQAVEQEQD